MAAPLSVPRAPDALREDHEEADDDLAQLEPVIEIWECMVKPDVWQPYPDDVQAKIREAQTAGQDDVEVTAAHMLNFEKKKQYQKGNPGRNRPVRTVRVPVPAVEPAAEPAAEPFQPGERVTVQGDDSPPLQEDAAEAQQQVAAEVQAAQLRAGEAKEEQRALMNPRRNQQVDLPQDLAVGLLRDEPRRGGDGCGDASLERVWQWKGDGNKWQSYADDVQTKINEAKEANKDEVDVSASHVLNFKQKKQFSKKDRDKWRSVRCAPPGKRKQAAGDSAEVVWQWKADDKWTPYGDEVQTRIREAKAADKAEVEVSKSHVLIFEKEKQFNKEDRDKWRRVRAARPGQGSDSESEDEEEDEEEAADTGEMQWEYKGDKGNWTKYPPEVNLQINEAKRAGHPQLEVPPNHILNFTLERQVNKDDHSKWRGVRARPKGPLGGRFHGLELP